MKSNSVGITLGMLTEINPMNNITLLKKKDNLLFSANDIIIYLLLFIKVYNKYHYKLCAKEHITNKIYLIKLIFSIKSLLFPLI